MISRQPMCEGTVMGAVSLENTISGAALKYQSGRDDGVMQLKMHCWFWTFICTIRTVLEARTVFLYPTKGTKATVCPHVEKEGVFDVKVPKCF